MALVINNYEYLNEDTIDDELKCIICTQPFLKPVSLHCKHTFCQSCIETWIKQNSSCPICRHQFGNRYTFSKVTTYTVRNQLDCLLVRCLQCNQTGIQRGYFKDHFQQCSRKAPYLLVNRCHSIKTTSEVWSHRRELLDEYFRTYQRQQEQFSKLSAKITQQQTAVFRSYKHISNPNNRKTADQKTKWVFYINIIILAILFLMTLERAIIADVNFFGKAIIVGLIFWLWS